MSVVIVISVLAGCSIDNDESQNRINNGQTGQVNFDIHDPRYNQRNNAFSGITDVGFNDQIMVRTDNGEVIKQDYLGDRSRAYSQGGSYGYNDYNYHGQLNTTYNGNPTKSYNTGHDNIVAQKITDRLEHVGGVDDVAAIINGNTILVVIKTNNNNRRTVEENARQIVKGMAVGRAVEVVVDNEMFEQISNNRNQLGR